MNIFSIENSQDFIDQHPEGFYQIRFTNPLENEILFLNPAAERLAFGQWQEDSCWFSTITPEDRDAIARIVTEAMSVGSWDLTYRIQQEDGSVSWLRDQAIVSAEPEGGWAAFGSVSDITELQEAQLSLVQSEERFRLAALCVSDFLYEWDVVTDHVVWFGGKRGHRQKYSVGFPTSGEEWRKLLHPDELNAYQELTADALRAEQLFSLEYRVVTEKGEYRWWSDRGLCTRDEDGNPVRWFGAISDITTKREQQRQLAQTERAYKRLVESLMDLVWTIDEDNRFVFINGPSASILGFAPSQMIGRKFSEFQPPDIAARDEEMFKRVRRGEEAMHHRTVLMTSAWQRRSFSLNARIVRDAEESRLLVHGTARDVTDLHNLEQQFIQSQKMETVGKLAGGIAHDFNNLLTIIHGYASMLVTRGNLDGKAKREVTQIAQAAEKAEALTRQLLAFSRQQLMQPQLVDLNVVLSSLLEMLKRVIGEHISLETRLMGKSWKIKGDPNMIEQVLVNLVVNARDAMPDGGGMIRITLEALDISETFCRTHPEAAVGRHICLKVEDNGTGMPPEVAKHVFEPFFTTKEQGKGTGLGLPTVYGIVKQHQGWIVLDTEVGKGTAFKLFFPESDLADGEVLRPGNLTATIEGGSETILVVEDEPEVLSVASSLLAARGYRVWEARNAVEADVIFGEKTNEIDLLLSDIVLPGGRSGRDLANEFRKVRPELVVLFTSGYSVMDLAEEGAGLERTHFLQKPYSPSSLSAKVREVLDAAVPAKDNSVKA